MLAFIDESGCPGFKFTRGSDPVFGLGMVIFADAAAAQVTQETLLRIRARTGHKPEFKFSKSAKWLRDEFFQSVAACPFDVRALIVRKQLLHSHELRTNPDSFYAYFVKLLMQHDNGVLTDARIRIDGKGDRDFQRSLASYLRRQLGRRIKEVKMVDSERDPLIQLADMCVGAVTRAERARGRADRWSKMLRPRIRDVWRFE
jgi:hypothetical protein